MIIKASDISICITLPQHSWHEVDQIDIIFGLTIVIVYNSSYMQGFSRVEKTTPLKISKTCNTNPCVLCEDVYFKLKNKENELLNRWIEMDVSDIMEDIRTEINNVMESENEN